jgi:hypothetical protein
LIEVHLFGHLRHGAVSMGTEYGAAQHLRAYGGDNVGTVLAQLEVPPESVGNIFVNGRLLPRSAYPITLGYLSVGDKPLTLEECLLVPVESGDRVGIFPRIMSSVVV